MYRWAVICTAPFAIDGDTIVCNPRSARVRLLGIDAPELPEHCRPGRDCTPGNGHAAKLTLARLVARGRVECQPEGYDRYRPKVA